MKEFIKRLFHSYEDNESIKQNKIMATKKSLRNQYELIYWPSWYEVFFRPYGKRYGYFIKVFSGLKEAHRYMIQLPDTPPLRVFEGL